MSKRVRLQPGDDIQKAIDENPDIQYLDLTPGVYAARPMPIKPGLTISGAPRGKVKRFISVQKNNHVMQRRRPFRAYNRAWIIGTDYEEKELTLDDVLLSRVGRYHAPL